MAKTTLLAVVAAALLGTATGAVAWLVSVWLATPQCAPLGSGPIVHPICVIYRPGNLPLSVLLGLAVCALTLLVAWRRGRA